MIRFTAPLALLLLLALPAIAVLGWPSRGFGRWREIVSLVLRLAIVLCLVLALAGLEVLRPAEDLAVVFLVDASDSMPEVAKAAAEEYVRRALEAMGPGDQAAVIVFGGEALVERSMSPDRELGRLASVPSTAQTDLSAAIRLGLALYPGEAARRMVILSDGAETSGDGLQAARLAAASGVEIVAVPFVVEPGAEALLTEVAVPPRLRQGERFDLRLTVEATQPMLAGVRVLAGSELIYEGSQELDRGAQSFSLPLTAGAPGFIRYTVQIIPAADVYYQNNELAAFSQVEGPPHILMVAPPPGSPTGVQGETRPDEYSVLQQALEAAGLVVSVIPPRDLPAELAALVEYTAVVMVDVPARQLSLRQQSALQSYVRDLGGGLVAIGGPTSFGVGGYFHTPLEETLPVDMEIKDEQRRPSLAMVFIIDKSGSMTDQSGGVTKLELAKEAAARSVELLFPRDRVGVIAFDDSASWVVPVTDLADPVEVTNAIGSIRSGGGTDILAGLQAMARVLPDDEARLKHVILLTDGGADPTGIPDLVERLYRQDGITLTTVGVGQDAAPFLEDLARLGGGRYHFTADPGAIPSIFTEETTLATRAYIIEETFFPRLANPSPILSGLVAFPPLHGYVGTTAKTTAQTILITDQDDPLLAAWQYGLGRAVAFTSDASGRWARDWLPWQGFPTFWSQTVNFVSGRQVESALEVQVEPLEKTARLVVDALTPGGEFLNGYDLQANVVAPDGSLVELPLPQVAPGRYEGEFTPTQPGAYLVGVVGEPEGTTESQAGEAVAGTAGWVLSYSPEYRRLASDPALLSKITAVTGGRIAAEDPAQAFAHTLPAPRATRPIWPWLLALAALLLPLDIAARRLALTRADLLRGYRGLLERLLRKEAAPAAVPERSERMASLLRAKHRAREPVDFPRSQESPPGRGATPPAVSPQTRKEASPPADDEPQPAPDDDRQVSTAALLLARKRKKKEDKD